MLNKLKVMLVTGLCGLCLSLGVNAQEAKDERYLGVNIAPLNLGMVDGASVKLHTLDGELKALDQFAPKVVVLFFGFTQCPDVCPTKMVEIAQSLALLTEQERPKVQVIMVSIDPERDTPDILKSYVQAFGEDFIGMRGTVAEVAQATQAYKAFFRKVPLANGYTMEHSSGIYLLDKQGKPVLMIKDGTSSEDIAHDLKALLKG